MRARLFAAALIAGFIPQAQAQMAASMGGMPDMAGDAIVAHALLEQLEDRAGGPHQAFRYDGQAWAGGDYDKIRLKSEGLVGDDGRFSDGQHEILYDRAISTFFDLQTGFRVDIDRGKPRSWGAIGFQGLSVYFFEVEATAYISDDGHAAGRAKLSYDLPLTQRLILQPEIELNLYSANDPGRRTGAGLSDIDSGLRLRYEFSRKLAPYIGVSYQGLYGQTARYAQKDGETASDLRFVFGVRAWF